MSAIGKDLRMGRFRRPGSRLGLLVPIDHGLTIGPVAGLGSTGEIGRWIRHPAIDGVIGHKGLIERLARAGHLTGRGVMVHLNGMTTLAAQPDRKEMVTGIDAALRLGADAVSVQVNFDGVSDAHNLGLLGQVVDRAHDIGLPVLAMVYDKVEAPEARTPRMRHLLRVAIELGADAVKIGAPATEADLAELLAGASEDVPIYLAGGPRRSLEEFLALARIALAHGAAGLCAGRNVFERPDPAAALDQLDLVFRRHDERPALIRAGALRQAS